MSAFGAAFMAFLGVCIQHNYKFIGEWYMPEEGRGSPSGDQIKMASDNCFKVVYIYLAFMVFAALCSFRCGRKEAA